jgi:Zn-dependent oligopeptidase
MGRTYYWKLKQELFSLDDEKNLIFRKVLDGFTTIASKLYGLTFTEVLILISTTKK